MNLVSDDINQYCISKSTVPSAVCEELAEYTRKHVSKSEMLIGPLEASFLGFLIRALRAKRILEFGTYTGYSALAMAENLPQEGRLITLDIDARNSEIAKRYWAQSEHGSKIEFILGPAKESMAELQGPFDFVFIDADKQNYKSYLEASLKLLSENGVIVSDNVLWSGRVLQEASQATGTTRYLQDYADFCKSLADCYVSFLPIRDGLLLVQKK